MKGFKQGAAALLAAGVLCATAAYADNTAYSFSNGANAIIGSAGAETRTFVINELTGEERVFTKVLEATLSNSGTPKDVIVGLSFETMLFTETVVRSKGGNKSTSTADGTIRMVVTVDGNTANPGVVIFDKREQTLWAALGGVMECVDTVDPETGESDGIITFDECIFTDEEIGLILDTTAAHTFNFLKSNIGSGSHTIQAWASVESSADVATDAGSSSARAALGKGSLSVWEVHGAVVK